AKIVYPAEVFDVPATLSAILDERCTALHGVPAMFDSLFQAAPDDFRSSRIRTGIVAGAPVPRYLMELMVRRLGMREFTSSYGLTEASPTCFNAFTDDALGKRLTTVGTLMPHAQAKIVDRDGKIVPLGTRGELCMAGYQLQAGYWNNSEKTNEVMVRDAAGTLWLHTGDEAKLLAGVHERHVGVGLDELELGRHFDADGAATHNDDAIGGVVDGVNLLLGLQEELLSQQGLRNDGPGAAQACGTDHKVIGNVLGDLGDVREYGG
ncbi:hypothetical protein BN1708_017510, partial [Verticillium longisporum]